MPQLLIPRLAGAKPNPMNSHWRASVQGHPRATLEPLADGGDVLGAHTPPEWEHWSRASSFSLAFTVKQ